MHELCDIRDIFVNGEIYIAVGMFLTHFILINYKNFYNVFSDLSALAVHVYNAALSDVHHCIYVMHYGLH